MMHSFPPGNPVLIEFEKIRSIISARCSSEIGKIACDEIVIHTESDRINILLQQVAEFKTIRESKEEFPVDNFHNLTSELQLLGIESSVLPEESVLKIRAFVETIGRVYSFFSNRKEKYLSLSGLLSEVKYEKGCVVAIDKIFDSYGQIYDNASDELSYIRKSLGRIRAELSREYQKIIQRYRKEGKLSQTEESTRNGRRVLSIPVELKRAVNGVIHDYSASGKTFFLEPSQCVQLNNKIGELEAEERQEVRKILFDLSRILETYKEPISCYQKIAASFDLCNAKAKFAIETQSRVPKLSVSAEFDLHDARHPLLLLHNDKSGKATIPFNINLNSGRRILVISGPNAGGKTVCMKAAGLIQLMVQAGIPVPVGPDSVCGVFEKLFVDIGDSQSIEYELSTYSSRLNYMKTFIDELNERSLFLIDEFGSGTDPGLGGALAESILEEIHRMGAIGIITTHYLNLKIYADSTPGMLNGSMAFDSERLQPLFKLEIGKPGSSYAFVVAKKSGLSEKLIKRAAQKVDHRQVRLESLLVELDAERSRLEVKREELDQIEFELQKLLKETHEIKTKLLESGDSVKSRIKELERESLHKLQKTINRLFDELSRSDNKSKVLEKFRIGIEKQKAEQEEGNASERLATQLQSLRDIKVGTKVTLKGSKTQGSVESITNGKAKVMFGDFRTICKLQDLTPVKIKSGNSTSRRSNRKKK